MNEELQAIELTEAQAEAKIEKAEKWKKLLADPLFDELVTKDYLGDDAVRLTLQFSPKAEDNGIVTTMLSAKSIFSRFVGNVLNDGEVAVTTLEEHRQLRQELDKE